MRPIHLLDISCFIWRIHEDYPKVRAYQTSEVAANWLRATWITILNQPNLLIDQQPHTKILILDTKKGGKYWRHHLCADYKGGRGEKQVEYYEIKRALAALLRDPRYSHLQLWGCPLFEADDLIAEAVRIIGKRREVYIHTIDGDLLQLVRPNVTFAWCFPGKERIKDVSLALSYIENKLGICIRDLTHFGRIKAVIGDSSDGLPDGGPVRIFDLQKADRQYSLRKLYKKYAEFKKALLTDRDDCFDDMAVRAEAFITAKGLPRVFR